MTECGEKCHLIEQAWKRHIFTYVIEKKTLYIMSYVKNNSFSLPWFSLACGPGKHCCISNVWMLWVYCMYDKDLRIADLQQRQQGLGDRWPLLEPWLYFKSSWGSLKYLVLVDRFLAFGEFTVYAGHIRACDMLFLSQCIMHSQCILKLSSSPVTEIYCNTKMESWLQNTHWSGQASAAIPKETCSVNNVR